MLIFLYSSYYVAIVKFKCPGYSFVICGIGVKVGEELLKVDGNSVSELDMIYIESILKSSSSVDVTLRSVPIETTDHQPASRPPSEYSQNQQSLQQNQVVEAPPAVDNGSASDGGIAGRIGMNVSA